MVKGTAEDGMRPPKMANPDALNFARLPAGRRWRWRWCRTRAPPPVTDSASAGVLPAPSSEEPGYSQDFIKRLRLSDGSVFEFSLLAAEKELTIFSKYDWSAPHDWL